MAEWEPTLGKWYDEENYNIVEPEWRRMLDVASEYKMVGQRPTLRGYKVPLLSFSMYLEILWISLGMSIFCGQLTLHWLQPIQRSA